MTNYLGSIRTRLDVDPRVRFDSALKERLHPWLRRAAPDLVDLVASTRGRAPGELELSATG